MSPHPSPPSPRPLLPLRCAAAPGERQRGLPRVDRSAVALARTPRVALARAWATPHKITRARNNTEQARGPRTHGHRAQGPGPKARGPRFQLTCIVINYFNNAVFLTFALVTTGSFLSNNCGGRYFLSMGPPNYSRLRVRPWFGRPLFWITFCCEIASF